MEQFALPLAIAVVVFAAIVRAITRVRAMMRPPLRIQLVPVEDRAKGRFADSHRRELESLGFTPIGIYDIREMKGVTLAAFVNPAQGACAVVYRHPIAGVFCDMVCATVEDDRGLTVTNAPLGANLDHMPGRDKIYVAQGKVHRLYDELLAKRPRGTYRHIDRSNFMRIFESEYAREMEWRKNRGGPTVDEVRREAHAMGIRSEKQIQQATEHLRKQYSEPTHPGVR